MITALRLLSAGSIRRGVTAVIQMFECAEGNRVEAELSSAPKVRSRALVGDAVDVVMAARFPAENQHVTQYDAAISTAAEHPKLATSFVRILASPEGRQQLIASGID